MASNNKQLLVIIDGQETNVTQSEDFPVSINYNLEDGRNFQEKRSSEVFDLVVPATLDNSKVANSFHNPNIEDTTATSYYRNPRTITIIANGDELFRGKALLAEASHTDLPEDYKYNCLGQNGDWLIDLREKTLWDFISTSAHYFTRAEVEASWAYNGRNTSQDYVYAPVRYKKKFNNNDLQVTMLHLRPSFFIYPLIYRAFQSVGYQISSAFFDTDYFRRMVMPWVWGNFLQIDSSFVDILKFLATGPNPTIPATGVTGVSFIYANSFNGNGSEYIKLGAGNVNGKTFQLNNTTTSPGFDNNGNYSANDTTGIWTWTYKSYNGTNFGRINARFTVSAVGAARASYNSDTSIVCEVYKNGVLDQQKTLFATHAGATSNTEDAGTRSYSFTVKNIDPAGTVSIKFKSVYSISGIGGGDVYLTASGYQTSTIDPSAYVQVNTTFTLTGISIALGGLVDFRLYDKLKKYKILDFLAGIVDAFDLSTQTDNINKVVCFEPTHDCVLDDGAATVISPGFFSTIKKLDFTDKLDLRQKAVLESYSDTEREQYFQFKDDNADGGLKKFNARWSITAASGKYMYPERFKTGKNTFVNRFFSPVMHYNLTQWSQISTSKLATQMIIMLPENISNTSAGEAENELQPKLAWYKGLVDRELTGGWYWWPDPEDITTASLTPLTFPYMFAVNYKKGGHRDPVLTYSDQRIDNSTSSVPGNILARGLIKRFFLSRLAVQDYGKRYTPWLRLNNKDISNWMHREPVMIRGAEYLVMTIEGYKPLREDSTKCTLWKFKPITQENIDRCYPSVTSVMTNPAPLPPDDILYQPLLLFKSDIN